MTLTGNAKKELKKSTSPSSSSNNLSWKAMFFVSISRESNSTSSSGRKGHLYLDEKLQSLVEKKFPCELQYTQIGKSISVTKRVERAKSV